MTIAPDMLMQFGGAPVSASDYAGWWGNDIWFVDFDNGIRADKQGMNDIKNPQKDLYRAITDAGAGDVIYMRPRTSVYRYGSSPTVITPAAGEGANWIVPSGKHDLSIIGTSAHGGLSHGVSLRSYASLTTATLQFRAQYCTIENLGFHGIASQVNTGLVEALEYTPFTHDGYALTVNRCNFQVYKSSNGGALRFNGGRYNQCLNSSFWHNYVSIHLMSEAKNVQGSRIIGNEFRGATTDIDADIVINDASHTLIHGNIFDHGQPAYTSGIRLKYIDAVATVTGILSNNYFATTEGTMDAVACDLGGLADVANKCGDTLAAPSVWMTST